METKAGNETGPRDDRVAELENIIRLLNQEKGNLEMLLFEQNEKLLEMTRTDYLTNLYNRKGLREKLDYELRRRQRTNEPLCAVMFDVDSFKKINDIYGHLAGDKLLTRVASILKENLRNTDIVGRYGGEEFLAILPSCALKDAVDVAEKIRALVQEAQFEDGIRVTISVGVNEFFGQPMDVFIDEADSYLHKAKKNGRNRVVAPKRVESKSLRKALEKLS